MNLKHIKDSMALGQISASLLSYIPRLKEVHYGAQTMDLHTLSDELISDIRGFEDVFMESIQGAVDKRVGYKEIVVPQCECIDLGGVIESLKEFIPQIQPYAPKLCQEFLEKLDGHYSYRLPMCR